MKADVSKSNYCRVPLKIEAGVEKKKFVHRVIYETFSEKKIPHDKVIDHIDGNPLNNCFDNLRVCTQKENILFALNGGNFGKNNSKAIIIKDKNTNKLHHFDTLIELGKYLGYSEKSCSRGIRMTKTKKFKQKYIIINIK